MQKNSSVGTIIPMQEAATVIWKLSSHALQVLTSHLKKASRLIAQICCHQLDKTLAEFVVTIQLAAFESHVSPKMLLTIGGTRCKS